MSMFTEEFWYQESPDAEPELITLPPDGFDDFTEQWLHEGEPRSCALFAMPEGVDVSNIDPALLPF